MNKELKFRVWDKENNKFATIATILFTGYNNIYTLSESQKKRFIIQQFTGVKDKNGKEVYEGDIVDYFDWCYASKNYQGKKPLRGEVKWSQEYLTYAPLIFSQDDFNGNSFANVCVKDKDDIDPDDPDAYFEVIGNIFENPKLLK